MVNIPIIKPFLVFEIRIPIVVDFASITPAPNLVVPLVDTSNRVPM